MEIELSDTIVSHLGPFLQSESGNQDTLRLEIVMQNSVVKIKVWMI
jgi:hypothetical protein